MNMIVNHENFNGLVNSSLKTNSRIIAEKFGKRHDNVQRDIRALIAANPEWGVLNFEETPYVDPQNGQTYQMYEMTRDGYSMLVMGFNGKPALAWKIKFLSAFNAMEQQLRNMPVLTGPQLMAAALIEADATMKAQAAQIEVMKPKVEAFDRLDAVEGALSIRPAAKVLGIAENKLKTWLQVNRWAFRQSGQGPLQAYVEKRNCGYLDHKLSEYMGRDGDTRVSITLMITPKGMARLAQIFNVEDAA